MGNENSGRRRGQACARWGRKDLRLEALEREGWLTRGGFTASLRAALFTSGHKAECRRVPPDVKFRPTAYQVAPGEVRTIHFAYRGSPLRASTVRLYVELGELMSEIGWDYFPMVLHVDEERMLPLDIEAHRVTP